MVVIDFFLAGISSSSIVIKHFVLRKKRINRTTSLSSMYDSSVCVCVHILCKSMLIINTAYRKLVNFRFWWFLCMCFLFVFEFHNTTHHHHHLKIIEKIDPLSVCVCFKGSLVLFSHFIWSKFLVLWIIINFSFIHLSVCLFVFGSTAAAVEIPTLNGSSLSVELNKINQPIRMMMMIQNLILHHHFVVVFRFRKQKKI